MPCSRLLFAFRRSAKRPCRSAVGTFPVGGRHFLGRWSTLSRSVVDTFPVGGRHFLGRWSALSRSVVDTFTVGSRHFLGRWSALSPSVVDTFTVGGWHIHRRWLALSPSAVGPFTVDSRPFHRRQSALSRSTLFLYSENSDIDSQGARRAERFGARRSPAAFAAGQTHCYLAPFTCSEESGGRSTAAIRKARFEEEDRRMSDRHALPKRRRTARTPKRFARRLRRLFELPRSTCLMIFIMRGGWQPMGTRSQSPDWERACLRISDSGTVGTRRDDR